MFPSISADFVQSNCITNLDKWKEMRLDLLCMSELQYILMLCDGKSYLTDGFCRCTHWKRPMLHLWQMTSALVLVELLWNAKLPLADRTPVPLSCARVLKVSMGQTPKIKLCGKAD